jgi:plastocyanin domain-containing protein
MWKAFGSCVLVTVLAVTPASAVKSQAREQRVAIEVTSQGFMPATIHLKAGAPIVLVVTRKTDRTCAKEIVIEQRKIHRALPLNRPVAIRMAPQKSGTLRYACGMDMVAGTIVIE